MTRRTLLGASVAMMAVRSRGAARTMFAYVGCYTTARRYARGDGIHVHRVDAERGTWSQVQVVGGLVNPSFLAMSPDRRFLYSAHGDEAYATSYSVNRETGQLAVLNRAATGGTNGVHLALDAAGRFLLVANYSSGNVAVMRVGSDGALGAPAHVIALPGQPGPHRVEQAGSHPHQILFDPSGRFVLVPDKGLDRIFVFVFDAATGKLTPTAQGSVVTHSGSGPRHAAFHPSLPVVWVVNEIGNTVATYYWEAERGHLRPVQMLPLLPPDYTGESTGAEIAVSAAGRYVYCSNRGHDSIAIFAADPRTGLLTPAGWAPSRGRTPRFIGFDLQRRYLYAANEQSDEIVAWRADAETGRLTPAGEPIRNASPVVIVFGDYSAESTR